MNKFKYIAISAVAAVAGIMVSCTNGNDWEVDSSKAKVLQTKIPQVSKVNGEAALQITVEAFGCSSVEYQASTSADFTTNLASAITNSLTCKLTGLKGYENYYVRVRGLKSGMEPSTWMYYASSDATGALKTIMTNGVQLINDIPSTDITVNSVKISWVTEKDGVTYNPVKASATYSNGEEEVVTEYDLSPAEIAAKSATLTGLLNSTKYEIRILQDYGDGTLECIGFKEVKTQMAPPSADATLELTTETTLTQAMIYDLATRAKAARGSEEDYEATIIIPAGASITVQEGTSFVTVPAGMTLNFFGSGEETTRPTLIFPYRLDIPGKHTAIRFQNINLVGNPDNRQNSLYLINQSGTATNTSTIQITSCTVKNFGRSVVRLQASGGGMIGNIIIDDCIFQDMGDDPGQSYPIIYNQGSDGIENVEITNTTFDTCIKYIIRHNNTSGGGFKTVKFENCTFYNSIGNGCFIFDNSASFEAQVIMKNIVMGKLYLGTSSTAGKGIRAKGSNIWDYTTFDSYYQLSDVVWGGNKIDAGGSNWPGTFKSRYTTPEMYTDPDNHDFTLLHYLDAGDPRWKIEDTGDDGGDE